MCQREERLLDESAEVVRALGRNRRDRSFEVVPDGFDRLKMRRCDREENQRDPEFLRSRARELRDVRGEVVQDEQNPAGRILLTDRFEHFHDPLFVEALD